MKVRPFDKKNPFDFVIDLILALFLFMSLPTIITVISSGAFINILSGNEI